MAAVAEFANGLWDAAANGLAQVGTVAGAAGAAAIAHGGKLHGLRMPTSSLGLVMFGGLAVLYLLVAIMALSTPPIGSVHGAGQLDIHLQVSDTLLVFVNAPDIQ